MEATLARTIKGTEIYNDEDASSLTEDLRSRITAGHEELESQQVQQQMAHFFQLNMENLQAGIDYHVPKPVQPVPENTRFSPFSGLVKTGRHTRASIWLSYTPLGKIAKEAKRPHRSLYPRQHPALPRFFPLGKAATAPHN